MTCCAVTTNERKLLHIKQEDRDYLLNPSRTRQNALCGLARQFRVKLPLSEQNAAESLLRASTAKAEFLPPLVLPSPLHLAPLWVPTHLLVEENTSHYPTDASESFQNTLYAL